MQVPFGGEGGATPCLPPQNHFSCVWSTEECHRCWWLSSSGPATSIAQVHPLGLKTCLRTDGQPRWQVCRFRSLVPRHLPESLIPGYTRARVRAPWHWSLSEVPSKLPPNPHHPAWVNPLPELNVEHSRPYPRIGVAPPLAMELSVSSSHSQGTELPAQAPVCLPGGVLSKSFTNLTSCVEKEVEKPARSGCVLAAQFLTAGFGFLHLRTLV